MSIVDPNVLELLKQGSKAVRTVSSEYGKDIKIAVHYTNVDASTNIIKKAILTFAIPNTP